MNYVTFREQKVMPSKIVCIGRNYVDHIKELNHEMPEEPVIFIKPNSSVSEKIILPPCRCRYEGEISFIIEKNFMSGVAFGLDLTLGDIQNKLRAKGLPWEKSKAFDSSAVFSDFVELSGSAENLSLELFINGLLKQKGSVELMIYKPVELLEDIKKYFTMEDYDIIMTGTPAGVGEYKSGDKFLGKIYDKNKLLIEKEWIVN